MNNCDSPHQECSILAEYLSCVGWCRGGTLPTINMTGQEPDDNKHVCLEFREYVQSHEEHTNEMMNCILRVTCLTQGILAWLNHWFNLVI